MDQTAAIFTATELDRLRRLASDFAAQFLPIVRREAGRYAVIRLLGSQTPELKLLAIELEQRLWAAGGGRISVEVGVGSSAAPGATYWIDVDYFLGH